MVKKHKRQRGGFGMMGMMGAMAAAQMIPQMIKQFGGGKKRKTQKGGLVFPNRRLYRRRQRGGKRTKLGILEALS